MELLWSSSSDDNFILEEPRRRILPTLNVLLFSNLWTLLLVLLPVIISFPPANYYVDHDNWFSGNDVCRILEPFVYPAYLFVFVKGLHTIKSKYINNILLVFFGFASVLYIQGAGLHTASNMFKNGFETFMTDDEENEDFYYWLRTIWEHIISHYMYGTGLAIIFILQSYVHTNEIQTDESVLKIRLMVCLTSIVRGLLIAGACIEFPSGIIVGYIYLGLVLVWSIYYLSHNETSVMWQEEFFKTNKRPIFMSFVWSYIIAFIIMIIWCCIYGVKSRSQAGL